MSDSEMVAKDSLGGSIQEWAELKAQIDDLRAERDALTARVEALERSADVLLGELRQIPGPIFDSFNDTGRAALEDLACVIYSAPPALDLAKHDEAVRRDALEQAWAAVYTIFEDECDTDSVYVPVYKAAIFGIEPSTDTPRQEPEP